VIVGQAVTQETNDKKQLMPMTRQSATHPRSCSPTRAILRCMMIPRPPSATLPDEILLEEFLEPMKLTQDDAEQTEIPLNQLN
jgi:hypothetical protein